MAKVEITVSFGDVGQMLERLAAYIDEMSDANRESALRRYEALRESGMELAECVHGDSTLTLKMTEDFAMFCYDIGMMA